MKKRMRSFLVGILAVTMILGTAACSQPADGDNKAKTGGEAVTASDKGNTVEPKNGSTYKIGYTNNILVYNSWITLEATLKQLCGDKDWEYVVTDANGDINKQISDMEDLAAQSCDLIFVNTTDPKMLVPTINAVVEGGTPVIALDNVLSEEAKLLTTITADNRQNGYMVGEWVAKKVQGPIKAVIVSGVKGEHICELRRQGVLEGITESRLKTDGESSIEIVAQVYTDWYADASISGMEDVLARNIDFNVIISEADVMTLPVYSLLEERGMADKIIFASTADAQKEALEVIQGTDNYATGLNSFVQQAEIAVQCAMSENCSVEMRHINKSFGGVHALKDVSVQFFPGEIHSIVGENGAGKSTLIKILTGAYLRDSGEILINGNTVNPKSTFDMKKQGIGVIYQEFALAQDCTVAENIFIRRLSEKGGLVKWKKLNQKTKKLISEVGFDIEPTEVLSPYETQMLFEILENLKRKGAAIIYISHRLEDVIALSDRITVFRDGERKSCFERGEIDGGGLVAEMIGRNPDTYYPKREKVEIKEEVLRGENLRRGNMVKDISFSVHRGEVLGIAGLVGSGKTESMRLVFGADKRDGGEIYVENKSVKIRNPHDAMSHGINYLSESRKEDGVLLDLEIRENITLSDLRSVSRKFAVLDRKKEEQAVTGKVNDFMIKCSSIHHPVSSLSGGNQQKVSIAKTLYINNKVVILDEPTRGVDVGAKVEIYNIINEMVANGLAVIFVSSEIDEIVGMCDRVIVIGQGKVMGELKAEEIDKNNIIGLSAGVKS